MAAKAGSLVRFIHLRSVFAPLNNLYRRFQLLEQAVGEHLRVTSDQLSLRTYSSAPVFLTSAPFEHRDRTRCVVEGLACEFSVVLLLNS